MRIGVAARAGASASEAATRSLALLDRVGARAGLVIVDPAGSAAAAWNTPYLAYALLDQGSGEVVEGPKP